MRKVVSLELKNRMKRFRNLMYEKNPDWEMTVIFSKINQYYFTGTMQDGMLIIPREEEATFWVRRSYERALNESLFPDIRSMRSFRDAAKNIENLPSTVYIETESVPLALYQRFQKHFPFNDFRPVDSQIAMLRSKKSYYELSRMRKSGKIHKRVLEDIIPNLLIEGMSEADMAAKLFSVLIEEGHHGVTRFGMYDTEMILGQICFGESSIYPSYFNGAGGSYGMGPAVPLIGSRKRKLKKGDLVYIDVGCGVDGYNTDKTTTYMFGKQIPHNAVEIHEKCVDIQNEVASLLKPGNIPSEIYNIIMDSLEDKFLENFMGYGNRKVKFLGHGIGLLIDEWPVIANGFDEPLQKGMVLAVEPKHGIKNIGMVGIENTFIVTDNGGECITGTNPGLIPVF
ncbi:MAG: M24 family metallopeptidase [Methanomicrobiales archaeon]